MINELVLGAEGLIGAELTVQLRARGARVGTLDIKSGCDLRRSPLPSFSDYDRVWFLAWDTGGVKYIEEQSVQHQIYRNNAELCVRVFDELERSRRPFLFVTSQLAGQPTGYGMGKLMAEHWARQLGGVVARLWNVYGFEEPGVRSHFVTDFVFSGLQQGVIRLRSSGQERRRLLYKSDCVRALLVAFDAMASGVDIAGPEWVSVRHVADRIGRLLGVEVQPGAARGLEVMRDPQRAPTHWHPLVGLDEGLALVAGEVRRFLAGEPPQ
jgi:nucleoside-diphosphate-sugar epimerase